MGAPKQSVTTNASTQAPGAPILARDVWFAAAVLVATLLAYQPVWRAGVVWDDDAHLTRPELRSVDGLRRIWFSPGDTQQYYPLMHSAFWVQQKVWGDNPACSHIVNIVSHVLVSMLFLFVLRKLEIPGEYLAAMIFALHPVNVESVAWISELKNTLSGSLYLGSALLYLRFDQNRVRTFYWLSFGLFVLALLAKAVTATLAPALLVVFWWKRGKLEWWRDVVPLLPFFAYGIVVGLFIAWVEKFSIGADGSDFQFTIIERCLIAGRVPWFYVSKIVFPMNLMFFYPRWQISQGVWWQYLFPLATLGLLVGLWLVRKRTRAPLAAVLFFGGTLFPVLGFVNVYPFMFSFVADHFQYLASLGIIALLAGSAATLAVRQRVSQPVCLATSLLLGAVLATLTWCQAHQYLDEETLYRETLKANPTAWLCYYNLGVRTADKDKPEDAIPFFENAIRCKPDYAPAHVSLGMVKGRLDRLEEAVQHFSDALHRKPVYPEAEFCLAETFVHLSKYELAVVHYQNGIRLQPEHGDGYNHCAYALEKLGRHDEARQYYEKALTLIPDAPGIHYNLGCLLAKQGKLRESIDHLERALALQPSFEAAAQKLREVRATSTPR